MAKVYLVQEIPNDKITGEPKFDLTPAIKYGEIKTMFPRLKQNHISISLMHYKTLGTKKILPISWRWVRVNLKFF